MKQRFFGSDIFVIFALLTLKIVQFREDFQEQKESRTEGTVVTEDVFRQVDNSPHTVIIE